MYHVFVMLSEGGLKTEKKQLFQNTLSTYNFLKTSARCTQNFFIFIFPDRASFGSARAATSSFP
jgi:hypothetical protein